MALESVMTDAQQNIVDLNDAKANHWDLWGIWIISFGSLILAFPLFGAFFISISMGRSQKIVYLLLLTAMFGSFIAS